MVLKNLRLIFPKKSMFLCSKSKQLKKQFFKVNFPQFFHLNTWNAVLTHLDSLFDKGQEKHCSSKLQTKKKQNFSGKNWFSSKYSSGRADGICENPERIFQKKLLLFRLKSERVWKNVQSFKHFFPQSLPRLRRLQFRQLWRIFPPEENKEFAQNL